MHKPAGAAEKRLEQLDTVLARARRLLILTHDNPDPDALASGWLLMRVARRLRRLQVDLAYGGMIGRSENRTFLEVLRVPLKRVEELDLSAYQAIALVDCQPGAGNNSLPAAIRPTLVIDHHPLRQQTRAVPFYDVRTDYGATVSILSEYLFASEAVIDRRLATAAFYAIKSETQNLGRGAGRADVRTFLRLFPMVDNLALSRIEHPPVPRVYFSMIDQAIEGTRLHGHVAVTRLGQVANPDVVAEFADLMVRLVGIRWALVVGRFGRDLFLSLRTDLPRANAGRLIRRIVGREGTAGGHESMAGGKIEGAAAGLALAERTERRMVGRSLELLRAAPRGVKLVQRRAPLLPRVTGI